MSLLALNKTPYYQCTASGPYVTITLKHLLFLNWITLIFQREKETQILPSFLVDQVCILLYFLPWITRQVNANLDNVSFWFHHSKKKHTWSGNIFGSFSRRKMNEQTYGLPYYFSPLSFDNAS